jgi:predicted dehydrogenase
LSNSKKIRVALAGLGFGAEFVPVYLHHPNVESLTICDSNGEVLNRVGNKFMVERRTTDLEQVIDSDDYEIERSSIMRLRGQVLV